MDDSKPATGVSLLAMVCMDLIDELDEVWSSYATDAPSDELRMQRYNDWTVERDHYKVKLEAIARRGR